jgi:hypothetical protein
MDWMNAVGDLVERYTGAGAGGAAAAYENPHQDFQQVAQAAPREVVAGGLSQAFQSDRTPPFPQMLANLFSQSNQDQRAGLLNRIMEVVGPSALAGVPGLGSLSSAGAAASVTPAQAIQVSPQQVQRLAAQAERQDPSIVDEVSDFYAQHPQVVKAVGGLALSIALQHMLRR